jgi:hypothetical protein
MPNKTKRVKLSFKKVFLITLCVMLGIVLFKVKQAHNKLPSLLRAAVADLKLEDKGVKLSFEKATVTLVGSLSHPLGIRLKVLKAEYTKDCVKYNLEVETLVVPVKITPLYKNNKIDLGLVKVSAASLKNENLCDATLGNTANSPENKQKKIKKKTRQPFEKKIVGFFKNLKDFNKAFLKQSQTSLKYKGLLIYDLNVEAMGSSKVYINRLKALRGSGDLKYKAEWDAELFIDESKASVKGELVGFEKSLNSVIFFRKKESELEVNLTSYTDFDKTDKLSLNLKSVPLSYLSKIRNADFAGLNLRKTWLDSGFDIDVSEGFLQVKIKKFKIYGDFGLVETDANSPVLNWDGGSWSLFEKTQLKFQKINFFEILADRPQKKMSQVFKDVGSFNALIKLESLDRFGGDFETNNFSVSVRSRGLKAYQKIRFARGSVTYKKKKSLSFNLEDVDLENGDFEGFIKFIYDYEKKEIQTKFNVRHLKFDPVVTKKLLGLSKDQDFSIKGEGFISKTNLTKKSKVNDQSELNFSMSSQTINTDHWSSEGMNSTCSLKSKTLNCQFELDRLIISKNLQEKLDLDKNDFKKVKSTSFTYQDKHLSVVMKSSEQNIDVMWSSKQGLGVSTPESKKIFVRQLRD